jgi:hypothetical protein
VVADWACMAIPAAHRKDAARTPSLNLFLIENPFVRHPHSRRFKHPSTPTPEDAVPP